MISALTKKYVIYSLIDPRDNKIRYIGLSARVHDRYATHILNSRKVKGARYDWIEELKDQNLIPKLSIIESGIDGPYNAKRREA